VESLQWIKNDYYYVREHGQRSRELTHALCKAGGNLGIRSQAIVDTNSTRKDFLTKQILMKNPKTVGIFRLVMKAGSNNFRQPSIQGIIKRLKTKGVEVLIYEPPIADTTVFNSRVFLDLGAFKPEADIIIANHTAPEIANVANKVFTRDLFGSD